MVPEQAIVTIQNDSGSFAMDMELPTTVSIESYKDLLLEALKRRDIHQFGVWKDIKLYLGGVSLKDGKALADYSVWDGSILKVREKRV